MAPRLTKTAPKLGVAMLRHLSIYGVKVGWFHQTSFFGGDSRLLFSKKREPTSFYGTKTRRNTTQFLEKKFCSPLLAVILVATQIQ